MKFRNTFVLATLVAPLIFGCAEKVEENGPKEEELPNIKVELPPAPDFDEARAPVKWEDDSDNAYSIFGLRKDIDDRLKEGEAGQKIVVKGWVQEIYVPPECPEGQLCPPGIRSRQVRPGWSRSSRRAWPSDSRSANRCRRVSRRSIP